MNRIYSNWAVGLLFCLSLGCSAGRADDGHVSDFSGRYCGQFVGLKPLDDLKAVRTLAPGGLPPADGRVDAAAISFERLLALAEARPIGRVSIKIIENSLENHPAAAVKLAPRGGALNRKYNLPAAFSGQSDLVPVLKDIFQQEGVPHNFIWLAEVESAMDPEAESSAGAMGLFQLMPDTAKRFGLNVFPVDDRKSPQKSARAAASYLRFLRDEFGCWTLALAAYNAGEGRISRSMKSHRARTFAELAPHLPAETRQYVPRVMMTIALREDQARGVPAAVYLP